MRILPGLTLVAALLLPGFTSLSAHPLLMGSTAIIVAVASVIFHRQGDIRRMEHWPEVWRWLLTGLSYFGIILLLLLLTRYIQRLALHPDVPLSLYRFYSLNGQALLALGSISLLLLALYLFSHRLMLNIARIGLSKYTRLLALGVALGLSLPLMAAADLQFPLLTLALATFIYIALFDLFIDYQIPGLTWFVTWLVLFAIYLAVLLYQYQPEPNGGFQLLSAFFACAFLALVFMVSALYFFGQALGNERFPILGKPSLRNRIQGLFVLLTLLTFVVVGGVTISFFRQNIADSDAQIYLFVDQLIKVYVFLLLTTAVVTIAVANSITRPIVRLGEKLRNLQLGRNEPIRWPNRDEIGELIAEYNRMIAKLEESTEQLRQTERESAWREMAKQVAHEIKNPLTPMKLSLQHLLRTAQSNPQEALPMLQRATGTLIEQIDGLARIATEFSNFARMPRPENETFLLNDVVASVVALFAQENESGAELHLQLPEQPLFVFADKGHLIRVFNNLIKNALQAVPDERQGYIQVALAANATHAVVQVSDNGAGIPPDMRERVFQPNFTTKNSGTGLGLAMSKSIVEAAGGRIWLEDNVPTGVSFFVELPLIHLA
ncbi:MAG TPA: ATP-binding protein [Saprospiraceae bacterium]|nr:ATP-binding protein [Saprospiraceae bacterium]HMP25935.1 ATP-binding protein [Saprospiraceae bacterium]